MNNGSVNSAKVGRNLGIEVCILGVLIGCIVLGIYLDRTDIPLAPMLVYAVGSFLMLGVAIYLQMVLRELGHLVFGLATGYRFVSFRVGTHIWIKGGRGRPRRFEMPGVRGQCLMAPPPDRENYPFVLYNLGGAIVNGIFGLLFLAGYLGTMGIPYLSMLFLLLSVCGIALALLSVVPMQVGGRSNDIGNIIALHKNPAARRAFWIQLSLNEQVTRGVRLKDMPAEWFTVPTDEELHNPFLAPLAVFSENRRMDMKDFKAAGRLSEKLLNWGSGISGVHRGILLCNQVFCELMGDRDPRILERMESKAQQHFMKQMNCLPTVLRTRYAYALLHEGNRDRADSIRREFEELAKSYPYRANLASEWELMAAADEVHRQRA